MISVGRTTDGLHGDPARDTPVPSATELLTIGDLSAWQGCPGLVEHARFKAQARGLLSTFRFAARGVRLPKRWRRTDVVNGAGAAVLKCAPCYPIRHVESRKSHSVRLPF